MVNCFQCTLLRCDVPYVRPITVIRVPSSFSVLTEDDEKIGRFIAEELVEEGATLQMGIGAIPDAVRTFMMVEFHCRSYYR